MKLIKFTFHDRIKNWGFTDVKFDDINLFIGASGVGKSLILYKLDFLKQLLLRTDVEYEPAGIEWNLDFEFGGNQYNWEARFYKTPNTLYESNENSKIDFEYERILKDGDELLSRSEDKVNFRGKPFPSKLQANISLLELISEDEVVLISNEIKKIVFSDFTLQSKFNERVLFTTSYKNNIDFVESSEAENLTLDYIKSRDWHILFKLYVITKFYPELLKQITAVFSGIFPNVFQLSFKPTNRIISTKEGNIRGLYILNFEEKGIEGSLSQPSMSSGMYRTLIHICELYLSPKGTVFLYDEFENSLGINCIDEITDLILNSENEYQFILTSHHPYIINNIPAEYWKLVTRHGGEVKISNVYDEGIIDKNSKHEVFTQLINSSKFYNRD